MKLQDILSRKLVLVSGKGGVGKTTVAVLLALWASKNNKKVCLVEINSTERVAPYFDLDALGYKEQLLSPNIHGMNVNPVDSFQEYVLRQIRFKALFEAFVNNRFVTYFLNAVPGLNELLMLGKVYDLAVQTKGGRNQNVYDMVIVDGPATGHGVSTFEVPQIVNRAVKIGPMKNQTDLMLKVLKDPEQCVFCPVTMGEEMPAQECLEMVATIRDRLGIEIGPAFINHFHENPFSDAEAAIVNKGNLDSALEPYFNYSRLRLKQAQMNAHYLKILQKELPDIIKIPRRVDLVPTAASLNALLKELDFK